jgi:hypothetical protein
MMMKKMKIMGGIDGEENGQDYEEEYEVKDEHME